MVLISGPLFAARAAQTGPGFRTSYWGNNRDAPRSFAQALVSGTGRVAGAVKWALSKVRSQKAEVRMTVSGSSRA